MNDFSSPEAKLMASIRAKYGASIEAVCHTSSVPESFLAALVANETGGDSMKTRFEPAVFRDLCLVCAGVKAHYGSLGMETILPNAAAAAFKPSMQLLQSYATSWGLTQIMGYQVLPFGKPLTDLLETDKHLRFAVQLLAGFAHQHQLDLATEFVELFACWNTGQPDPAKTTDPNYCANGVARMMLYAQIV